MTDQDLEQLQRLAGHLSEFPQIGLLSPNRDERKLFPKAKAISHRRWDLNQPNRRKFDLLIASNVFMYSADPPRWFRNVLASCRYFLLLDLVRRQRSSGSEFGPDRDCMRYAIGSAKPRVNPYFDLNLLGDRLLGFRTFPGGANTYDDAPLHLVALLRGDLADPILRVDDYPTGIRPILTDLEPLHAILRKIDERGVRYYLGIVPALLTEPMFDFLRGLKHMVPVVHGYDHAYPRYAPLLNAKGDPFNAHTVGVFNEFKGVPYPTILERLREGRRLLEDRLAKEVRGYVPPCNIGDRRTARALKEAGYHFYLSEKSIPEQTLGWVRSDFYGRSNQHDGRRAADVVTLHVTWEWDLVREGDLHSLDRLLDHLAERKRAERERGARLGALVGEGGAL